MEGPPLTVGTAGHIDHGKTVLVRALTGVDTDRLPEERRRGISIELGFARLELPSGRALSVVDVPGHERFVRTMVAGATGIDMFLLVVAADDGVMPQTREHVAVLEALEVPQGAVAVTKADAVSPDELELAIADVGDLLREGPYADAEIVAVSGVTGAGLDDLRASLDRVAALVEGRAGTDGTARLHVDRSFTLKGIGTVVTGTLWSGELRAGEEVRIVPRGSSARVRSIEVHDNSVDRAAAGQRVALNLAAVDRDEVERGDVVTTGPALAPTYLVDAVVRLGAGTPALRRGMRVQVHHGTRETPARVAPIEGEAIEPGSTGFAQLRLERPIVPAAGDHFVIRQIAPPDTIGGGVVLDPHPRKHGPGAGHVKRLTALTSGDPLERLAVTLDEALSGLAADGADTALLERLQRDGRATPVGGRSARWFSPRRLAEGRAEIAEALARAGGRPASRGALAHEAGLSEAAAVVLLDAMVAEGEARPLGPGFVAGGRAAAAEDPLGARLLEALEADWLEPRAPDTLASAVGAPGEAVRAALGRLALEDGVVRVKPGLYYHRRGLEEAQRRVIELCGRNGSVTIARLRDELGTSRKYAQALLEHFDAERLTRRRGDEHLLR
jgi:selenocysteine-specific elongation factor